MYNYLLVVLVVKNMWHTIRPIRAADSIRLMVLNKVINTGATTKSLPVVTLPAKLLNPIVVQQI